MNVITHPPYPCCPDQQKAARIVWKRGFPARAAVSVAGEACGAELLGLPRQGEDLADPELEAERRHVIARLQAIGDVAGEMGEAGLLLFAMALLGRVAV